MADAPRVSPQAGKGGAELPAMGALLRHLQTQVAKAGDGAPVSAVAGVATTDTTETDTSGWKEITLA